MAAIQLMAGREPLEPELELGLGPGIAAVAVAKGGRIRASLVPQDNSRYACVTWEPVTIQILYNTRDDV